MVSTGESGGSLSGTIAPSMRKSGGEPVVMCMSLAPFSIMARSSWWRLTLTPSSPIAICYSLTHGCSSGSVGHGDAEDLFRRGHAFEHLPDARHAQRDHARGLMAATLSSAVDAPWSTISFRSSLKRITS